MNNKNRYCAIVDAFSTGNQLAPLLKEYGFTVIHVQSTPQMIKIFESAFHRNDFEKNIIFNSDIDTTAAELSRFPIEFIITGTESGVELSDMLSHKLNLVCNDITLSKARRDKFHMLEALTHHKVRTMDYMRSKNAGEIIAWSAHIRDWPVVLKPTRSAGSDNVIFCNSIKEIEKAFNTIYGRLNRLEVINDYVIAQSFLKGQEYIVDSVSWDGAHLISEIWKVNKKIVSSGNIAYDIEMLEPATGIIQQQLIQYIKDVLDALGIKFGPAHAELCLTKNGPVLIEIASRMHGGISCPAVLDGLGYNHPILTTEAYANTDNFKKRLLQKTYAVKKYIYVVTLISLHKGIFRDFGRFNDVKKLSSFHSAICLPRVNQPIEETIDLFTSPGIVYLVHEDKKILEDDYHQIREWEKEGLFELAACAQQVCV